MSRLLEGSGTKMEAAIYWLGALTLAIGVPTGLFKLIDLIEKKGNTRK